VTNDVSRILNDGRIHDRDAKGLISEIQCHFSELHKAANTLKAVSILNEALAEGLTIDVGDHLKINGTSFIVSEGENGAKFLKDFSEFPF